MCLLLLGVEGVLRGVPPVISPPSGAESRVSAAPESLLDLLLGVRGSPEPRSPEDNRRLRLVGVTGASSFLGVNTFLRGVKCLGRAEALAGVAGATVSVSTPVTVSFLDALLVYAALTFLTGLSFGLVDMLTSVVFVSKSVFVSFFLALVDLFTGLSLGLVEIFAESLETVTTGLPSGVILLLLRLLLLVSLTVFPKFSVSDNVSFTFLFLNSKVSNFSSSESNLSCPKSDTKDKVSVTVLFRNSSWSYFLAGVVRSWTGLIFSPVVAPEALLERSMLGVIAGVTPEIRLDLLIGVAGVVLGASARSSSSAVIVVFCNLTVASELTDPVSIGTVEALLMVRLLLELELAETSIMDTLLWVESVPVLSTTGVVASFLGLPLFLVLDGGANGTCSEANWSALSSLSDSMGSVDATLGALLVEMELSAEAALDDLTLLGLPEAVS